MNLNLSSNFSLSFINIYSNQLVFIIFFGCSRQNCLQFCHPHEYPYSDMESGFDISWATFSPFHTLLYYAVFFAHRSFFYFFNNDDTKFIFIIFLVLQSDDGFISAKQLLRKWIMRCIPARNKCWVIHYFGDILI